MIDRVTKIRIISGQKIFQKIIKPYTETNKTEIDEILGHIITTDLIATT